MADNIIELKDILLITRKNFWSAVRLTLLCVAIAFGLTKALPKKFRSSAVLNIPSSYFKNPLVSNLISESDSQELQSQRQALLQLALDEEFIDFLGTTYSLFKFPLDSDEHSQERSDLLKSIEYYSLNSNSFKVSYVGLTTQSTYGVVTDVLKKMTLTLIEERYRTLLKAHDAIENEVKFITTALIKSGNSKKQVNYLQEELKNVELSINILKSKYTSAHPEMANLNNKAQAIKQQISKSLQAKDEKPANDSEANKLDVFTNTPSKESLLRIYEDLIQKLSNLNIILDMEKDRDTVSYLAVTEKPTLPFLPIFPKVMLFLGLGAAIGATLSVLNAIYEELKNSILFKPDQTSDIFSVPLLGELPELFAKQKQLLIATPTQKLLPAPDIRS